MRGIDTNVLVRFLVNDDPEQSARAREVVETGDIFVSLTIMLEAEWVLRSAYGLAIPDILAAFEVFAGLPGVTLQDPEILALAIERSRGGMDFADALHLGGARDCEAFLTFDRKLVKAAEGQMPIATLLV